MTYIYLCAYELNVWKNSMCRNADKPNAQCKLDPNKPTGPERALFSRELNNVCEYQLTKLDRDLCRLVGRSIRILCIDF